jgi:hypothetical protein
LQQEILSQMTVSWINPFHLPDFFNQNRSVAATIVQPYTQSSMRLAAGDFAPLLKHFLGLRCTSIRSLALICQIAPKRLMRNCLHPQFLSACSRPARVTPA